MNKEQIRARQLIRDLEIQARELKEEISFEMAKAIVRALEQAYTIGQEELKIESIEKIKQLPGVKTYSGNYNHPNKRVELAQVLKIYDISITK